MTPDKKMNDDVKAIGKSEDKPVSKKKHGKQPTQHTPMQRVMVVGPTGKRRMVWREWEKARPWNS